MKFDQHKPKISLVPLMAVEGVARIRMFGVEKYVDPENWRNVENIRYIDAALRHIFDIVNTGNMFIRDEESGLPQIDHAICNLMFISQRLHEEENKDGSA